MNNLANMPSIKKNVLLQKDDVGRRKEGFHKLPGPDFTYGKSDHATITEGVGAIVHNWSLSKPSEIKKTQ